MATTGGGWHFVMPVPGSGNSMWRKGRGRTYIADEHAGHQAGARLAFRHVHPLDGELAVVIRWYRQRRVGDVDNRTKTTLDVLAGIAYVDDGQVADLRVLRIDDGSRPRVEVTVGPLTTEAA